MHKDHRQKRRCCGCKEIGQTYARRTSRRSRPQLPGLLSLLPTATATAATPAKVKEAPSKESEKK